jgi:hypothetical protein
MADREPELPALAAKALSRSSLGRSHDARRKPTGSRGERRKSWPGWPRGRPTEIAAILELSPRTVGNHLGRIFARLGVETHPAAARIALTAR